MKRRSLPFLPKPNLLKTFFAFFFLLALSTVSFASNEDPASPDYDGGKKNLLRKALPLSVSAVMAEAAIEFRGNVVNFAAAHEGIPYVLGGYSTNGFDCSGFMRYVLDYYDIPVTTTANQQAQKGQRMPIEMARPGDLVFFGSANFMTHVAMVYSNDENGLVVVHATSSRGIVKEDISNQRYWMKKIQFAVNVIGF